MGFSDSFINFVFSEDKEEITYYIHQTKNKSIADQILEEGFQFSETFQKTTDILLNDPVYVRYWATIRKGYGTCTIVIGIANSLLEMYQKKLKSISEKNYEIQQLLTETPSFYNKDDEEVFILPTQFIKGFLDKKSNSIKKNPTFDPFFISPVFEQNFNKLKNKKK